MTPNLARCAPVHNPHWGTMGEITPVAGGSTGIQKFIYSMDGMNKNEIPIEFCGHRLVKGVSGVLEGRYVIQKVTKGSSEIHLCLRLGETLPPKAEGHPPRIAIVLVDDDTLHSAVFKRVNPEGWLYVSTAVDMLNL